MTQPKPNPPLNWNAIGEKERDVLVHLEVMGGSYSGDPTLTWMEPPNYSTSISDAMKVLEKFDWVRMVREGHGSPFSWTVEVQAYSTSEAYFGRANTLPEAICLAALRASGLTIE